MTGRSPNGTLCHSFVCDDINYEDIGPEMTMHAIVFGFFVSASGLVLRRMNFDWQLSAYWISSFKFKPLRLLSSLGPVLLLATGLIVVSPIVHLFIWSWRTHKVCRWFGICSISRRVVWIV